MEAEINKYINRRYERWLDYAKYHCCSYIGSESQANDILDEVMLSVMEKDDYKINCLYNSKKGQYRELDFYILRMIKLNIYSPTSPYQSKYHRIPEDHKVHFQRLKIEIIDESYEETDRSAEILAKFNQVREIFNALCLGDKPRKVFEHRFFHDLPFSEWKGPETKKELYDIYNKTVKLIKMKINKSCLI